jgi:hypothetical protein
MENMEKVTRIISRCRAYELLYHPDRTPPDCLEDLHRSIIKQYAGVLRIMGYTYKQLSRNTLVRGFTTIFNRNANEERLNDLSLQETQVSLEANICDIRYPAIELCARALQASSGN